MVERKGIIPDEDVESVGGASAWSLPSLDRKGKKFLSAKKEQENRSREAIENVSAASRPKYLTADDINKITKEAEEEGFKAGYEEGFSKGEVQGEKKGRAEGEARAWQESKESFDKELARLSELADRLSHPTQIQDAALETSVIDIIQYLASKLIQKEITTHPEDLHAVVSKAMQALPAGSKNISIFLHPNDVALLEKYLSEKKQQWPLQEDDSLTPGGCRIETRESLVDYSIEKRWKDLLEQADLDPARNARDLVDDKGI